jgi:hypothetical protein
MLFFFWLGLRCVVVREVVQEEHAWTYRHIHALPQLLLKLCAALDAVSRRGPATC